MRCPRCHGYQIRVIETRPAEETVRRRRKCLECGLTFYTREVLVERRIGE